MALEIERKFLVRGEFRHLAASSRRITQGYICATAGKTVRVRLSGEKAYLTIKGPSAGGGFTRFEFEQAISTGDAMELFKLCDAGLIDKERYLVPAGKQTWEVDVFHGENEGLVIAEIELDSESESFEVPTWIGKEVTDDKRYYNSLLATHPYSRWKKEED